MIFIAVMLSQGLGEMTLPRSAIEVVRDVLAANRQSVDQALWKLSLVQSSNRVRVTVPCDGRKLEFVFFEDGYLSTFDDLSVKPAASSRFQADDARRISLDLARRWNLVPNAVRLECTAAASGERIVATVMGRLKSGYVLYVQHDFTFALDGSLTHIWNHRQRVDLTLEGSPKLPTARLQYAAREAYWKQGPYESAVVSYEERFIGFPYIMDEHPKLTVRQKDDLAHNRGIPFYFMGIRSAEFADDPGHWIYVDARDGTIISYIVNSGRGLGPPPSKRIAIAPPGQKADVNGKPRKLFATGESVSERPEGKPCRVVSGISLWLGRLDSKGDVWLSLGPKGWCGYRVR